MERADLKLTLLESRAQTKLDDVEKEFISCVNNEFSKTNCLGLKMSVILEKSDYFFSQNNKHPFCHFVKYMKLHF